jgi:hypothetical protein
MFLGIDFFQKTLFVGKGFLILALYGYVFSIPQSFFRRGHLGKRLLPRESSGTLGFGTPI